MMMPAELPSLTRPPVDAQAMEQAYQSSYAFMIEWLRFDLAASPDIKDTMCQRWKEFAATCGDDLGAVIASADRAAVVNAPAHVSLVGVTSYAAGSQSHAYALRTPHAEVKPCLVLINSFFS